MRQRAPFAVPDGGIIILPPLCLPPIPIPPSPLLSFSCSLAAAISPRSSPLSLLPLLPALAASLSVWEGVHTLMYALYTYTRMYEYSDPLHRTQQI